MNVPVRAPLPQVQFTEDGRRIFELQAGTQLEKFFLDRAHVSGIRGPIGSAKTATAFQKVWQIACEQSASPGDGLRKTRWGFIRNTYGELEGTTVKDFLEQFPPEQYGEMYYSRPLEYHMSLGDVRCEIVFMALDRPEDIKKIRSTQFTGFFLHEMQYLPKEIFDECESRTGRYPSAADGFADWDGVLFDMNEPGEDHWLLPMTGEQPYPEGTLPSEQIRWPKDWRYYVQPPALIEVFNPDGKTIRGYKINPRAENLKWLKPDYYPNKIKGKEKSWIDSRLMNRISVWVDGKPVWPQFNTETHVANAPLKPMVGYPIILGMDFGRSPAVVFGQLIGNRWYLLDELCAYDIDTTNFAPLVKRKLDSRFPQFQVKIWGDPKGQDKAQSSERTSYDIMASFGMPVQPAPCADNDLTIRLGAVTYALNGLHDGAPRFLLCPEHCRTLKVAMAGKYHFRKQRMAGGFEEKPYKDRYSNCFPAGTPVSTPAGARAIETLRVGDFVTTPEGPREVTATMSREVRKLVRVTLTDGREVVCTPDHLFAVEGGFIQADALQYLSRVYGEGEAWDGQRNILSKSSMGAGTTECRRPATTAAILSSAVSSCTATCGNSITVLFRSVARFITAITTKQTTGLRTSNCKPAGITRGIISRSDGKKAGSPALLSEWQRFDRSPPLGIAAQRAASGIANMLAALPRACPTSNTNALIAAASIASSGAPGSAASAPCRVRGWPAKRAASTTWIASVWSAARRFARTNILRRKPALAVARLDSLPLDAPVRVYDLTVDRAHCFYANGVLVHNCADALQYLLVGEGEGRTMVGRPPGTQARTVRLPARRNRFAGARRPF